jgi:putative PIN family toxin of toxin-antitoxin system
LRILCDVNILVRANEQSDGPVRRLLLTLLANGHTLLLSGEMLVELARVLRYPRLQMLFGLSEEQIYQYVQFLREVSELVSPDATLPVPIRDPKDIVVLQTAVCGDADVICTLDRDFYDEDTMGFCAAFGIDICDDRELAGKIARPA